MNDKSEIQKLKLDFLDYLESELERSPKTLENYDRYITQFISFSNVTNPKDIDEEIVKTYKKWLEKRRIRGTDAVGLHKTMHKKTQNYHLIALRAFLKFLKQKNITSLDPSEIELIQYTKNSPNILDEVVVEQIRISFIHKDVKSLRDKAIFLTLLRTGARVSELCALNRDDFREDSIVLRGKQNIKRKITLPARTIEAIMDYLELRRDKDNALFVNNGKRASAENSIRLTPRSVQRIIRQCALQAGVTDVVTPHSLRHTFALTEAQSGKEKDTIQETLGYKNPSSIDVYS
jgi:site-specific recombinase XerD